MRAVVAELVDAQR